MKFKCCKHIKNWFKCHFYCRCCEVDMDCENDTDIDNNNYNNKNNNNT